MNLEPMQTIILTNDTQIKLGQNDTFHIGEAVAKIKDAITVNPATKQYINTSDIIRFKRLYLKNIYNFNTSNKLAVNIYKIYKDKNPSSNAGASIQLFNKIGDIDIYNELIYKKHYTNEIGVDIDDGYDYSIAMTYHASKKLLIKLKGENIFDKASQTMLYSLNPDKSIDASLLIPARTRKAIISMEYTF